jgi:3-hydroxyisobutyrate dehydrogenase
MAEIKTIAVLGAGGTMGFPIARNLARAGFEVRAWNRSEGKAEPLSEDGATVVGSPAEAAAGADAVLTVLADADAVLDSVGEALGAQRPADGVWLQMSTIGEAGTERCIELACERGVSFVDAPVLGTRQPAEQAELVILASGPSELREQLASVFDAIGKRTMWVGEAGAGSRLKLATNSWILAIVEGAAETLALAEGLGLDPRLVLEAVAGGPLDLPYLQMKGMAIIERDFEPSFKLELAAKDAALVDEAARSHGLELPLVETIRARLEQGAGEHAGKDMSATYLTSAPG